MQLLVTLGERLQAEESPWVTLQFLRKVQQAHPTDFYANFLLGNILFSTADFRAAADYFRAAAVLRLATGPAPGTGGYYRRDSPADTPDVAHDRAACAAVWEAGARHVDAA